MLFVRRVPAAHPRDRVAQTRREFDAGRRYLAKYSPRDASLSVLSDGWHEFICTNLEGHSLQMGETTFPVEHVELVGDVNGWQTGLSLFREQGSFFPRTVLELPDGVYHYKFLVNGCIWLEDLRADERFRESDGRGGYNSGVLVGLDGAKLGPSKPNHINAEALKHDPRQQTYLTPIAEGLARVTLRTLAGDVDSAVVALYGDGGADDDATEGLSHSTVAPPSRRSNHERDARATDLTEKGTKAIPMRRADSRHGFDYWTAQVLGGRPGFDYAFRVVDDGQEAIVSQAGATTRPTDAVEPFPGNWQASFETPDWAKKAIWYQIFPERFRNGDPSNDPPRTVPWTHEWFKPYKPPASAAASTAPRRFEETGTFYQFIYDRRYGGDIQGIRQKLPYLRGLGVTAIYLNPVFSAPSLHKYDAADYRHIDDYLAVKDSLNKIQGETTDPATWQWSDSDRLFLDFLAEAHRQGFKVIIDGVFNHVGREFWAFQDVLKNKQKSAYADWFDITSWEPFHYQGWDREDGALPRLKHDEKLGLAEPVRQHLFAVTRRWMDPNGDGDPSDGIDGWRLDVASDVNAAFWRDWRKLVKSINPDAYIVAELWDKSVEWLTGDTFDGVMNYPLARIYQRFFVNRRKTISPTECGRQLQEMLRAYPSRPNAR